MPCDTVHAAEIDRLTGIAAATPRWMLYTNVPGAKHGSNLNTLPVELSSTLRSLTSGKALVTAHVYGPSEVIRRIIVVAPAVNASHPLATPEASEVDPPPSTDTSRRPDPAAV